MIPVRFIGPVHLLNEAACVGMESRLVDFQMEEIPIRPWRRADMPA